VNVNTTDAKAGATTLLCVFIVKNTGREHHVEAAYGDDGGRVVVLLDDNA
jgi:hypothetical protein